MTYKIIPLANAYIVENNQGEEVSTFPHSFDYEDVAQITFNRYDDCTKIEVAGLPVTWEKA